MSINLLIKGFPSCHPPNVEQRGGPGGGVKQTRRILLLNVTVTECQRETKVFTHQLINYLEEAHIQVLVLPMHVYQLSSLDNHFSYCTSNLKPSVRKLN